MALNSYTDLQMHCRYKRYSDEVVVRSACIRRY